MVKNYGGFVMETSKLGALGSCVILGSIIALVEESVAVIQFVCKD